MFRGEFVDLDFAIMDIERAISDLHEVLEKYKMKENPHNLIVLILRHDEIRLREKVSELKMLRNSQGKELAEC